MTRSLHTRLRMAKRQDKCYSIQVEREKGKESETVRECVLDIVE